MKLFKHKKNDRKESIKTKAEQATVVLLTKIFQKFGVNNTRVRDKDCVKNRVKRAKIVRFTLC